MHVCIQCNSLTIKFYIELSKGYDATTAPPCRLADNTNGFWLINFIIATVSGWFGLSRWMSVFSNRSGKSRFKSTLMEFPRPTYRSRDWHEPSCKHKDIIKIDNKELERARLERMVIYIFVQKRFRFSVCYHIYCRHICHKLMQNLWQCVGVDGSSLASFVPNRTCSTSCQMQNALQRKWL